jgi:hypothetical protein
MNSLSVIKNKKGLIGLALLTISLLSVIIASFVLFNSFYVFFKTGLSEESASTDYESLSSGIYYGVWLAGNGLTGSNNLTIGVPPVQVTVTVTLNADNSYAIIAIGNPASAVHNREITCQYANAITSWN